MCASARTNIMALDVENMFLKKKKKKKKKKEKNHCLFFSTSRVADAETNDAAHPAHLLPAFASVKEEDVDASCLCRFTVQSTVKKEKKNFYVYYSFCPLLHLTLGFILFWSATDYVSFCHQNRYTDNNFF